MYGDSGLINLPLDIIIKIFSHLPIRTIALCKCVCKELVRDISTKEFVQFHPSRGKTGLFVHQYIGIETFCRIYEFKDETGFEQHALHYNPVLKFDTREFVQRFNYPNVMNYSVDGLLCMTGMSGLRGYNGVVFYIFNPFTREYIMFVSPKSTVWCCRLITYGFGVSRISGEYKVVKILYNDLHDSEIESCVSFPKPECNVYTLGKGLWRSVAHDDIFAYRGHGVFLNGNLHWFVKDTNGCLGISCLDLETELFHQISVPSGVSFKRGVILTILGDCLCFCDNSSNKQIIIWVMKEYGVGKSWTEEFVIGKINPGAVYPLKVFKDGSFLMTGDNVSLLLYCNKTKTLRRGDLFEQRIENIVLVPLDVSSLISLKRFESENVRSY